MGGGSGDVGYECFGAGVTIFAENVSLEEDGDVFVTELAYDKRINATALTAEINGGTDGYTLFLDGRGNYGDENLVDPPLYLAWNGTRYTLVSSRSDIHAILIAGDNGDAIAMAPCFEEAVEQLMPCFENSSFSLNSGGTVPANSNQRVVLRNARAINGRILMAGIMEIAAPERLAVSSISFGDVGNGYDGFTVLLENLTANPILYTTSDVYIRAFCMTDCSDVLE